MTKNKSIDFDFIKETSSKNFLNRLFSYKLNIDDLDKIYQNKEYKEIINKFALPFLFNKQNKKIYLISIFVSIFLRIVNLFIFVSLSYGLIYLLDKVCNLHYEIIYWIFFPLYTILGIFHIYISNKFVKISKLKNKQYIKKKWIINASLVNIWLWTSTKQLYKFYDIYNDSSTKNNLDWNEYINVKVNSFFKGMELFFNCLGFYENAKVFNMDILKKYKQYKITKKWKPFDLGNLIMFFFTLKYGFCLIGLYLFFCASIALVIYSLINVQTF